LVGTRLPFQPCERACGSEQRDDRKHCCRSNLSGSWRCSPHADAASARYGWGQGREDIDVMGSDVQGDGPPDDIHED